MKKNSEKISSAFVTQYGIATDANHKLHTLSVFVTAFCAIFLCLLINAILYNIEGMDSLTASGLKSFAQRPAISALLSSKTPACVLIALIIFLLFCDFWIYRRVVKKIFEHFSIIFTSAGAITLLFMLAYSSKLLYFIISGALIFIGAVLMLIYIEAYHALNKKISAAKALYES